MDSRATFYDGENRRDGVRKPYPRQIFFDFSDYIYPGMIRDISPSGVFIETDEMFKPGQMIIVNIPEPRSEGKLRIAADVVRIEPDGIGLKFMLNDVGRWA